MHAIPSVQALLILLLIVAFPGLAASDEQHWAPGPHPDRQVLAAFERLEDSIEKLPSSVLDKGQRSSLSHKIENAEEAYERGRPCTAASILDAYLHETQALRKGKTVALAEQLYAAGRLLRDDVLAHLVGGMQCPGHERAWMAPTVQAVQSDNRHFKGRVVFGEPRMWSVQARGETFTELAMPGGARLTGPPGLPGVPVVHRLVAFPRGAEVSISTSATIAGETLRLNLYPYQPQPADEPPTDPFADLPFVKDAAAYSSSAPFPPAPCTVTRLGQFRDLPIAQVSCSAGHYSAATDTLTLFDSLEFDVTFGDVAGGNFFLTQAALGPFEPKTDLYTRGVLNKDAVLAHIDHRSLDTTCAGEELLIITPGALSGAAEGLAQWKRSKGIATSVVLVGPGTTADQIDAFIEDRFDHCAVRPSYVLLFGDAEFVPTFYTSTAFSSQTGSDYRYAVTGHSWLDFLPRLAVGRLPVDTSQQAWDVVDKIIRYESAPPVNPAFYQNVSIASEFQCCRWDVWDMGLGLITTGRDQRGFIQTVEGIREMLAGQGYAAQRIYTKTVNPTYEKWKHEGTPRRYYDGTDLPADLAAASTFAWTGSTGDIVDAFNAGRFLFLHRDHGSWNRWVHPSLTKGDVDALTNGDLLPVVFSMNCSTGLFDNETNPPGGTRVTDPSTPYPDSTTSTGDTFFAERLLRNPNGGAVGVIAATRDSPTWANDALTRGLFDAVWPTTVPDYGPPTSVRRLGDILNYAKLYIFTELGAPGAPFEVSPQVDALSELFLWHVLGDPTLEMWTSAPRLHLLVANHGGIEIDAYGLRVHYSVEGATITALQPGTECGRFDTGGGGSDTSPPIDTVPGTTCVVPIGRGIVTGGVATLQYIVPPAGGVEILLSASMENAVSRLLTP